MRQVDMRPADKGRVDMRPADKRPVDIAGGTRAVARAGRRVAARAAGRRVGLPHHVAVRRQRQAPSRPSRPLRQVGRAQGNRLLEQPCREAALSRGS
jgi:hypothetical protein